MHPPYDQKITAQFKSVEYAQYVKYSRFKIVVEGGNPIREFKSEELLGMLAKDTAKTFAVFLDSKNPENYWVDISELKKKERSRLLFWIIGVPWIIIAISLIALFFSHTK